MSVRVPPGVPDLLRDLIHEKTGLVFDEARRDTLEEKAQELAEARGCGSLLDYYFLLKDGDEAEWARLWEGLTVPETYFWREMSQIHALTKTIVPAWFAKRPGQPFRIWSAACATGEEPYTIAMALIEAGHGALPIEITASDATPAALEKARAGVYREKAFRTLSPFLRQKYFTRVEGGWKISPELAGRVTFSRANLSEPADVAARARVQALFCRNVFIYFSKHAIRQTTAGFASKMTRGSHLFVGAAESLLKLTTDFELVQLDDALAYRRI